ncbi:MAG: hypothetical protein L6Q54_11355 [Leptospiraceae bacterium]|nr:hypothetical protein [Leptospiraceae bacterium]MCK6381824.1 hypothetical protein [Leptospiraceae bacterium]NUM40964.1 hypothetical protein [Leptospiraceae bacterium]
MKNKKITLFTLICFLFVSQTFAEKKKDFSIDFVKIPQGEFQFDNSYYNQFNRVNKKEIHSDKDVVTVKISGFHISSKPITRMVWEKIIGDEKFSPWSEYPEKCPECPAENLLFKDAVLFLDAMSMNDFGKKAVYRLPTESELIYIFSQCEKKSCDKIKSFGSQIEIKIKGKYKNQFGITPDWSSVNEDDFGGVYPKKSPKIYFFTEDFPSNNYLSSLKSEKQILTDPKPQPDSSFNYGRTLLSFFLFDDKFQINRLGHSINMLPENSKVYFYAVKK